MKEKDTIIKTILSDMERVKENLLSLSEDIWKSIDHNNPEALEEGIAFKREYNQKVIDFDRLSTEISTLVQQYTSIRSHSIEIESKDKSSSNEETQRIILELNREEPHSVIEDYMYKRPIGFILKDRAFKNIETWKQVLETFCLTLYEIDPEKFKALPDNPHFISRRGNPTFSRDLHLLRSGLLLRDGIYSEVNLSANSIMGVIRELMEEYGIKTEEVKIFLRQDRDA